VKNNGTHPSNKTLLLVIQQGHPWMLTMQYEEP